MSNLFKFFFFFKKIIIYSNKLKSNEYFFYTNNCNFFKYLPYLTVCSLFDIVCFDNSQILFLKNYQNFLSFFKFYIYNFNIWLNVITNKSEFIKLYKNNSWYIREAFEFFGVNFFWKFDTRNLLTQYSSENFILLKKKKLLDNYDIKTRDSGKIFIFKNSIVLCC